MNDVERVREYCALPKEKYEPEAAKEVPSDWPARGEVPPYTPFHLQKTNYQSPVRGPG